MYVYLLLTFLKVQWFHKQISKENVLIYFYALLIMKFLNVEIMLHI